MIDQLESIRSFGEEHRVPIVSRETAYFLCTHIDTTRPHRCLEIWSAIGYSTLLIGMHISARWWHLTSYEISLPSYRIARANLASSWVHNVSLYHGDVMSFPKQQRQESYDFVFIDGAKAQYSSYLRLVLPLLRPHATIVCDDVISYEHKMQWLQDILTEFSLSYERIALADGDWVLLLHT